LQYHLKYKTRGNSTPQGKPKVYFCCHPSDFELFFADISDEILEKHNCSVWYAENVNIPRDANYLDELLQMQLFVMPVTSKLLHTKNYALDIEFRFALEHHIPVLPIMLESGLEDAFNKKCGSLHFLYRSTYDVIADSYEQRLEKYLSSVLIGDEMAKRVRDAFCAYIFLSYRKMDRKYAQELMRLIHKNEFCRDIAIWYDEFLTPGENFNDAIKQAIEKSDFFVMTVTPNLVEDPNYIMTTEYPAAQKTGKRIIPAVMINTDRSTLLEKYKHLPTTVDAYNEDALMEILLSTVQALAIKQSDDSPEHTFFIGLAYLDGIDVEIDYQRALALISSAAEAGVREAIVKLVHMYETGKGVEKNYEKAVAWREKLIIRSEEEYRRSPEEGTLSTLFWDVIECADAYDLLGKEQSAREKYEYSKALIESSGLKDVSHKMLRNLAVSYVRLGDFCNRYHQYTESNEYFEKTFEIINKIYQETGTVQSRYDLVVMYRIMGIPGRTGKKASLYREKAIAMAEELVSETGSKKMQELLFQAYKFHGIMLSVSKPIDLSTSRRCYEKALAIAEAMLLENDTPNSRRNLADIYGLLASLSEKLDDMEAMWSYLKKELCIDEELVQKTDMIQDWRTLAHNYLLRGLKYEKIKDFSAALSCYERSIEIRENLVLQTDGIEYINELYRAYDFLGGLCRKMGKLRDAAICYQKKILVCEKLTHLTQTSSAYIEIAIAYCRLGEVTLDKTYFQQALDIYGMLRKKFPKEIEYINGQCNAIKAVLDKLNNT